MDSVVIFSVLAITLTIVSARPADTEIKTKSDQQGQTGDPYSVHMNGSSNAPAWKTSNASNEKMYAVPTQLKEDDVIIINGTITDGLLDIALRPDGGQFNIVCQLNVVYPENGEPHDQIVISHIKNGTHNTFSSSNRATDYFNGTTFDVRFQFSSTAIKIYVNESYLESIELLSHTMEDIKFISVRGEVKKLCFAFNGVEEI